MGILSSDKYFKMAKIIQIHRHFWDIGDREKQDYLIYVFYLIVKAGL